MRCPAILHLIGKWIGSEEFRFNLEYTPSDVRWRFAEGINPADV
jgi:hypothetical protein